MSSSSGLQKSSSDQAFAYETNESASSSSKWQDFKDSFKRSENHNDLAPVQSNKSNLEKGIEATANTELHSSLTQLHQSLITLAGCVGSGLLVVSGQALSTGGPGSVLLGWAFVSSFLYCVMQSLSELSAAFAVSGSFFTYATRFIDPSFGYAAGLNYSLFWLVVLPLELVAASLTINFWHSDINNVVWVSIFYVMIIGLNLCGTAGFAHTELFAAVIKILGIVGFDILAIVLICGGGKQGYIGGKYWHNPGTFNNGFKGFTTVLITATYSLAGTELVGLTVVESASNPRIALPRAIKQVFYRIIFFFMLTLTLIGFLVPSNSSQLIGTGSADATASPFVIAIKSGGIKVLPSIFNVVVLVALLSIGNSSVYGFSRTTLALAQYGLVPKFFAYIDRRGRPLGGIIFSAVFGLLAFVSASPKQGEVFAWLVALSALSTLFTWGSCTAAHIRFRAAMKVQGRSLDELPYLSKTGVWGSYYATICLIVVLGLQFWISLFPLGAKPDPVVFFKNYLGAVIVVVCYVGHKIYSRNLTFFVPLDTMDLDSGRTETDVEKLQQELAEERESLRGRPWYVRAYYFLF